MNFYSMGYKAGAVCFDGWGESGMNFTFVKPAKYFVLHYVKGMEDSGLCFGGARGLVLVGMVCW